MDRNETIPDCFRCLYFRVTWDKRYPRACRVFNIKSRVLPSLVVLRNTGHNCPAFREREEKADPDN